MTLEDLYALLQTTDIPVVYRAWTGQSVPPLPWLCYLATNSDNFGADNVVYFAGQEILVELYTAEKSPELENRVEAVLTGADLYWEKTETYIDSQHCYQVAYDITV